jgi:hypothetical protein
VSVIDSVESGTSGEEIVTGQILRSVAPDDVRIDNTNNTCGYNNNDTLEIYIFNGISQIPISKSWFSVSGKTVESVELLQVPPGSQTSLLKLVVSPAIAVGEAVSDVVYTAPPFNQTSRLVDDTTKAAVVSGSWPVTNGLVNPPTITSAVVENSDPSTIVLTFDSNMDQSLVPVYTAMSCNTNTILGAFMSGPAQASVIVQNPFVSTDIITFTLDGGVDTGFKHESFAVFVETIYDVPVTNNVL